MISQRTYSLKDWCQALEQPASESFQLRQHIASELAQINQALLRIDATEAELEDLLAQVRAFRETLPSFQKTASAVPSKAIADGLADQDDVYMAFDYDALIGNSNPAAPGVTFHDTSEQVIARTTLTELHQGGPGKAHGGVLAGLLDVVLARVQHRAGFLGVTGNLKIRYLRPTYINKPLELRAWSTRQPGRIAVVEGGIWMEGLQTVAAEGLWIAPKR